MKLFIIPLLVSAVAIGSAVSHGLGGNYDAMTWAFCAACWSTAAAADGFQLHQSRRKFRLRP